MKTDSHTKSEFSEFFKAFLEREYGTYRCRPRNANGNAESITLNELDSEAPAIACPPLPILHKEF